MTHALTERAMVMTLSIGVWKGYRLDREATRKITTEAGAKEDAARVNKHLIPKEALKGVQSAGSAVRDHFYANSLPWRDNGDRLMTRKLYMTFIQEHEALVDGFNKEAQLFAEEKYRSAIEQAEFRMGTLFDPDDYPSFSDVRRKFYVSMDISPIATANDFRVEIDAEHVERVKADIEAAAERRIHAAQADVWKRLAETVGSFAETMDEPDKIFRNSKVTNLLELLEKIPGLNVLDNPDIEAIRQELVKKLGSADADEIRKNPDVRAEMAGEAKAIMDRMGGFMRAFGVQ